MSIMMLERPVDLVVVDCQLDSGLAPAIAALAAGKLAAIRVKGVSDPVISGQIAQQLSDLKYKATYRNFQHMETIGMSFFEAVTPDKEHLYFSTAHGVMQELRQTWAPQALPTDVIRAVLDETWPTGLMTLRHPSGKTMRPCLARTISNGTALAPHVDRCDWYSHADFKEPYAQLSGNIYLSVGESGGELVIWNSRPRQATNPDICECSVQDGLGEPDLVLAPRVGEMILVNSQLTHAVNQVQGLRSTLSFFLVLQEENSPLQMYH
jgi:hypothetical protein